jgi:membrane protease YdiL (CAAX protease family)
VTTRFILFMTAVVFLFIPQMLLGASTTGNLKGAIGVFRLSHLGIELLLIAISVLVISILESTQALIQSDLNFQRRRIQLSLINLMLSFIVLITLSGIYVGAQSTGQADYQSTVESDELSYVAEFLLSVVLALIGTATNTIENSK